MERASILELSKNKYKDADVLSFLESALAEARLEKWVVAGDQHSDWNRRAAMYYGKDRFDKNPWVQRPRENRAFRSIENQRYVLMDHMATPEFLPRNPTRDYPLAQDLTDAATFVYDVSNYKDAYAGYVHNLLLFGTGVLKVFWCPDDFGGKGMVRFAAQDPRTIFVNPGATSFEDATYVIAAGLDDVDGLVARYPEYEDEIKASSGKGNSQGYGWWLQRAIQKIGGREIPVSNTMEVDDPRAVEVIEVYARIPRTPLLDLGDEGGKKVDHRIRVFKIIGGKVVVRNEWLPFQHGKMPFISSKSRYFADRLWGISDLEVIESLQQELNRMADKRNAWIELSYFPWVINPSSSGVPDDQLLQAPGAVLHPTRPDHGLGWLVPPEAGRHIQSRRQEIHNEIDEELGTYVITAEVLRRNIAPTTIAQAREAGEAPVRMKIRLMQPAFEEAWLQAMDLMRQYFDEDVTIMILDEWGQPQTRVVAMKEGSNIKGMSAIDNTQFRVRVGLTGNAAISRAARRQEMVEAIQAGAFNRDLPIEARIALLDSVEFPGRQAVINKWMAEEAAQAAQMQAQMLQQQQQQLRSQLGSTDPRQVQQGLESLPEEDIQNLIAQSMGGGGTQPPQG